MTGYLGRATLLSLTVALAACAAKVPPVQVTRFHLGQPIAPAEVVVEPRDASATDSLEFRTYATAIQSELSRLGFRSGSGTRSELVAVVDMMRGTRDGGPSNSGISIGLGGGGGSFGRGGGVGLGGGVSFPIGKRRSNDVVVTELSIQLKRRSEGTVVWEGRAQSIAPANSDGADPAAQAARIANAIFQGFPGESGRTVAVK